MISQTTTPISIPFSTAPDPFFEFQRQLLGDLQDNTIRLTGRRAGRSMAATLMFAAAYGRDIPHQNSVLVNERTMEDIRRWGVDELDEQTRREVLLDARD